MREIQIGEYRESVVERSDFPPDKLRDILGTETLAVLGYGVQGRGQSLNLRDGGFHVIVGLRPDSPGWKLAIDDGWIPNQTLFTLDEAAARGSVVLYLLSDAGQKDYWPRLAPHLTPGKGLCFAHGFSIVYQEMTGVVPPNGVDVFMVAPKGSGTTLRRNFLEGRGLNSSFAIHQNATGRARNRCLAIGVGIGAIHQYETTFAKETVCDLVGERGVLVGAIYGLWLAQYEVLREHGHSPTEAFNETVEEATQSLYPLIGEKGMDWMYANCSTTAQRGALDWFGRFKDAVKPIFEKLYAQVADGTEAKRALDANAKPDYRASLERELRTIAESEIWRAGQVVRELRDDRSHDDH